MKKLIPFDILAVASLIGAYIVKYFTVRKIGMVRWLNYNGNKLREMLPEEVLRYLFCALAVLLTCLAVISLIKKKDGLRAVDAFMCLAMCALTVYYVYVTFTVLPSVTPCSFLLVPLTGLTAFMLIIRNLVRGAGSKKSIDE